MTKAISNIVSCLVAFLILGAGFTACTEDPTVTTGSLSGLVTKGPEGTEPLQGVSVSLSPVGLNKTSDFAGAFSFSDLQSGSYTLQFTKDGYESATRSVTLRANDNLKVDVTLRPIVTNPNIEIVNSSLIFDAGINEMVMSIRNTGTAATCDWTITGITASWLSVTPRNGTTRKGSTSSVKVLVDREQISSSKIVSTTFSVESEGFSLPVYVEVTNISGGNQGETEGNIEGRVVDSESGGAIANADVIISPGFMATATNSNGVFKYEKLKPGLYTVEVTAIGYNQGSVSINVNGGSTSSVTIRLVKKDSGGGEIPDPDPDPDPNPQPEDYSKAEITTCDSRVAVAIVSCVRYGSSVTFTYTLTNNGLGDVNDWRIYPPKSMSLINGGTRSSVWTNDGAEYYYPTMTFRSASTSGSNVLNTSFPQGMPCTGTVSISGVSGSANEFNLNLGVYAYPNSTYHMANSVITFRNVPIY